MRLNIVEAGEVVLRQPARELGVEEILHPSTQDLIAAMYDTMRAAPGVGLAAPQIGLGIQLAVIEDRPEYVAKMPAEQAQLRMREAIEPHVIINPKLTLLEDPGKAAFFEGCLSLPGFTAIVPRAVSVRVECLDETATPRVINAKGWYARILQHEIDHLRGMIYIDRMLSRTFMGRENFERHWSAVPIADALRVLGA